MKMYSFTHSRKGSALAFGAMVAAGLFSINAHADEWTKRTILTVNEPIQVKDTVLPPGKYVFRLILNGTLGVDRHVVQIFDGNEMHIINTVVTQATIRPHATGTTQFTYWETPPGTAKALRDWYYPGETTGDEFPYPNQPKQMVTFVPPPAVNTVATVSEAAVTPPPAPPAAAEQPQPETAEVQPPPPAEQPAAAPPAPEENSANRERQELPKTGSPYPLIGLSGLVFAGLGGALLLKRTA
jgi:LPXTG-motif cell wall-anchored protein